MSHTPEHREVRHLIFDLVELIFHPRIIVRHKYSFLQARPTRPVVDKSSLLGYLLDRSNRINFL